MSDFMPVPLKEDPPPSHAVDCRRCELANQRQRVIWGEGTPGAPIFILLDNPGMREDAEGNPFVCGTREALQQGMYEAGLAPEKVYVSFLLKCRPRRAYNKPLARETCFPYFQYQLSVSKASLLLGLGNTVVQTLFPHDESDVKSLRGRWHDFQGIPIAFSYHPLAVRRRPALQKYLAEDLRFVVRKAKEMSLI
ncbi:uracil-DNA glycosylase [Paenibacillus doosanensis]|uniref:Uracil DNA glycosylase superfamily protein n=1 Tax=Paenibacillus konkukensis TaxID=2020716 RepID=A0ABY4RI98_9BACL|nr:MULTISPECIES: uracil-DNA glycosylase [Paenibacillus]MCS7460540.1 uracil-DNA glycosylase [Paenibacillus doosanensis]UQZ81238.1 Uracil DNA glycosylase superfamily protein [Paenibacillus konkukensis]